MRTLPFPARIVTRAIAVFLLPLVNKTLVEVDTLFTYWFVSDFFGELFNCDVRALQLGEVSFLDRLKRRVFEPAGNS